MSGTLRKYAAVSAVFFLLCAVKVTGQQRYLGLFNSPKGFGIEFDSDSWTETSFDKFVLYTDVYGTMTDRTNDIGAILSYTKNYIFQSIDKEYVVINLYWGAGATVGYVHDFEKGGGSLYSNTLKRGMGGVAALGGTFGMRADFGRALVLDLSLRTDVGLFLRNEESNGAVLLSVYRNGLIRTIYPQLSLLYRF